MKPASIFFKASANYLRTWSKDSKKRIYCFFCKGNECETCVEAKKHICFVRRIIFFVPFVQISM